MAVALFVWIFILICLFGLGWLFITWTSRGAADQRTATHPFLIAMAGLVLITAFANCWAYFAPVGILLNGLVFLLALIILIRDRAPISLYLQHWSKALRVVGWPAWLGLAAILFIALVKSASPTELLDEGDYYLPYIRWIENYRIIPGLANIEGRLGFNSAFHMASAFFGLSWLVPGGAYDLNGLLLLLFASWCLGGLPRLLQGKVVRMSDVMKLFCLFFLMRNMITASAADLSNMILAETVIILFVQKIEDRTVRQLDARYWIILALALFTVTIKLSSILLCLVPLYLTGRLLWAGHRILWGQLAVLVVLVVLPWLGRYTVLSGYPVYPVYKVDLFDLDWKVPRHFAEQEYHYVIEFAKTNARPEVSKQLTEQRSAMEWVPQWFARENMLNRAMALAMLAALIAMVAYGAVRFRQLRHRSPDRLALGMTLLLGIVFWFFQAPAFRFGWAWGITLLAFCLHVALGSGKLVPWLRAGTLALFVLSMGWNTVKTATEGRQVLAHHLLLPAPMPEAKVRDAMLGPVEVRISTDHQCWGTNPPCLPVPYPQGLQARGSNVEDGFRIEKPSR